MKYKVSVIKKIAFLVMTMALVVAALVVLSGCQEAVGKTGPAGPAGEPGTTGTPGTTDNAPPTLKTPFKTVYLALGGTGAKKASDPIDLGAHFTDVETQSLDFKAASAEPTVAKAKVAAGKLTIEAKKVGTTSVTVSVYDSVNDPVTATIPVTVVAINEKPMVTADQTANDLVLHKKLFVSRGTVVRTISAVVNTGLAGTLVDLPTPVITIGAAGATDDIVSVAVAPGTKPNTWNVAITPLKPGVQLVKIDVADIFGVESMKDIEAVALDIPGGVDAAIPAMVRAPIDFLAIVNTPPKLVLAMPDKVLKRVNAAASGLLPDITYFVDTYFDLVEKGAKEAATTTITRTNGGALPELTAIMLATDDMCVYSTSPTPTAGVTVVGTAGASVESVKIDAAVILPITVTSFDLTITCSDAESSVSDTATISVRP